MAKVVKEKTAIEIQEIKMGRVRCNIVGTSPLIMHRFASKAWRELLFPSGRKNSAERAESLKHDPIGEFREAVYINRSEAEPALIHFPNNAFSKALAAAALDIPGANKSQISRLTSIASTQVNFFGCPQVFMAMVRSSDMNHTPDVRSRPIFPEWACTIEIQFVSSLLKQNQVINLLAAAGVIVGLGDWRPQKGGNYGQFKIVGDEDEDFRRIVKTQGRVAQRHALAAAESYDADTEELLAWFKEEVVKRERFVASDVDPFDEAPSAADIARATKSKPNGKRRSA